MEEHLQFERNQRGPFGMGPWQAANAPEEEGHAAARKADRTGMNRAALWMSIGGLFLPYVSVLVHVAAIVMAVVGLRAAKAGHADSRGAAIAALAISAIGLAAYVPLTMILLRA
ncbi:hypothetical protein [Demequina zhanjiangensis]|uniref:DUF4190 domain-containing protein n=1 Tax=Demequina zhanjiangensis TaxID=3051659 RepID=A0ABT8G3B0_9MICO|nr:hypothetical protein [Demequina sp. SYSU T00b26]MDN4473409.1 hypothetical protein [Demequina sp. SYSU T00b26]